MTQPISKPETKAETITAEGSQLQAPPSEGGERLKYSEPNQPQDSYVKLAMRNMVRKGGKSLRHFFLTTVGFLALLIGLAYLTKP